MTIFHAGFRLNGSQDPRAAEWKARQVEGRVIFGVEGGAAVVEPGQQAHEWVRIIRETSITYRKFWRECTPGYYNNEGEEALRSHLGEPYGPGFYAFDQLLREWRDQGDLEGLVFNT